MNERESTSRIPRWVKVLGIVAVLLALLVLVVTLLSPDDEGHGPQRHGHGESTSWQT